MEHKTFAQFLIEKEKIFQTSLGGKPTNLMAKGAARPANPAKMMNPFQGVHFPAIYGKPEPKSASGVIGKK